jgi:hypothetical protein
LRDGKASGEIQQPFCNVEPDNALVIGTKSFELKAFNLDLAFGQQRRQLKRAGVTKLFLGFRLKGNFGCGFLAGIVGQAFDAGVDVFQSRLKRPFRTSIDTSRG